MVKATIRPGGRKMNKKIIVLFLIISMVFTSIFPSMKVLGEKETSMEIQDKLKTVPQEEKEILETLFSQMQEIEELERENKQLNRDIRGIKGDTRNLEKRIFNAEEGYEKNLVALEAILKSYQKMGAASYLEIVLESESLQDFLRRANLLRDISRNSKDLLQSIENNRANLEEEKRELSEKLVELEEKQNYLKETIEEKQKLAREQEEYLADLSEDRYVFEERLGYLSLIMEELKEIIGEFTSEFKNVVKTGRFPKDTVKESITLRGIKGTIDEKTFNEVIKEQENLPPMEFKFNTGNLEMIVPGKDLYISGNFNIVDDRVLSFQPTEGSFLDMPLQRGTIEELFERGDFVLDLEPLIGKSLVKSVEIKKGYLELIVSVKIF